MRISLIAVMSTLLLAGCAGPVEPAKITTSVAPAAESISPKGIEAKAEQAVGDYFAMSAAVAADGGVNPDRLAGVVTKAWLKQEKAGFAALQEMGTAQTGVPEVTKLKVTATRGIATVTEVVVHACTSMAGVGIVTEDGEELPVDSSLALLTVYLVPVDGELKVDGIEPRQDTTWCEGS